MHLTLEELKQIKKVKKISSSKIEQCHLDKVDDENVNEALSQGWILLNCLESNHHMIWVLGKTE